METEESNSGNCSAKEEPSPSILGTKDFWDQQYATELENFQDHGDVGEIWFGKQMMNIVVNWVAANLDKKSQILDLGCGNGILLVQLAQKGFENLSGVDYSEAAVTLAKSIAGSRNASISFRTMDVLSETAKFNEEFKSHFDLLLDKGTYDAITLMEGFGPETREKYLTATANLLRDDGRFVITTCNWTGEEIIQQFSPHFCSLEVLPTPSFQFGGKKGNNVSVVVFKKTIQANHPIVL